MATIKKTDLIPVNPYNRPNKKSTAQEIAIHYTADCGASAEQLVAYYHNVARGVFKNNPTAWTSANYIVGYDGTIITCIRAGEMSYAVSGHNDMLINIEVCYNDPTGKFTDAATDALAELVQRLMQAHGITPARVKRHYDYTGKMCPMYYVQHQDAWERLHAKITGQPYNEKYTITAKHLTDAQRKQVASMLKTIRAEFETETE